MNTQPTILLIERDQGEGGALRRMLESGQYLLKSAASPQAAEAYVNQILDDQIVDLVICDLATQRAAAFDLLAHWRQRSPQTPIVLVIENGDAEAAIEGMKLGAVDCLTKPLDPQKVRDVADAWAGIRAAIESSSRDAAASNGNPRSARRFDIPIGTSLEDLERAAVQQALEQHQGNRTHAAKELGISVRTLQRKLKTWGQPILSLPTYTTSPGLLRETY